MGQKKKRTRGEGRGRRAVSANDAAEARFLERAKAVYRQSWRRLREAQDPVASKSAYEAVWGSMDEMGRELVESVEEEEGDDEPDEFVDEEGRWWTRVTRDECSYHTLRGTIRVRRGRYRSVRNGRTRCLFEERRGVLSRSTMPDLGKAILEAYAEVPGDEAARLLKQLTRNDVPVARLKRFFVEEASRLKEMEHELFKLFEGDAIAPQARSVIVSVDALSIRLRGEGWKQPTVATLTMVDGQGQPVGTAQRPSTIRLAEMPQAGKARIMEGVEREVRALKQQRPELEVVVVIDGAPDLRDHLLERFPDARHLVDFFHVVEHLSQALHALFPHDESRRATERAKWCHRLKHKRGTPWRLWRWLRDEKERSEQPLARWAKSEVERHAEYIYNQRPWMKYPQAVEANVAIGSGRVEAACKTVVTQRLKTSGATWSRRGAEGLLFVRSMKQSGRFERAFEHALEASYPQTRTSRRSRSGRPVARCVQKAA